MDLKQRHQDGNSEKKRFLKKNLTVLSINLQLYIRTSMSLIAAILNGTARKTEW